MRKISSITNRSPLLLQSVSLAVLLAAGCSTAATAQQSASPQNVLPTIVVSPTSVPTPEAQIASSVTVITAQDIEEARQLVRESVPAEHLEFIRALPLFYENDYALYVHAGLEQGKHPSESSPQALLWTRDLEFYKNYRGKPCIFGHTPTPFLPLLGRLGRHGIYISHSAIGIDTGYNHQSPLSCLSLPDFALYQAFADGREEKHHITSFIPEKLREMQRLANHPK